MSPRMLRRGQIYLYIYRKWDTRVQFLSTMKYAGKFEYDVLIYVFEGVDYAHTGDRVWLSAHEVNDKIFLRSKRFQEYAELFLSNRFSLRH